MKFLPIALFVSTMLLAWNTHALTQAEAEAIAKKHLASLPTEGASYDATQTLVADMDGDGKPEIVLLATLMGPTYAYSQLMVFSEKGKGYVEAGTSDLSGNVEDMAVDDGVVQVKSKMPGPNDPRCCPSLEKNYRYALKNGKIDELE